MGTDLAVQGCQSDLRPPATMDGVVVQNDVDALGIRIATSHPLPKLQNEQVAVLAVPFHAGELTGPGTERTRQGVLLVRCPA